MLENLRDEYFNFDVFGTLVGERKVTISNLEKIRDTMQVSIEEFAKLCDDALLCESKSRMARS